MKQSEAQIPPDARWCSRMAIEQLRQFYELINDTAKAEELKKELLEFDKASEKKTRQLKQV